MQRFANVNAEVFKWFPVTFFTAKEYFSNENFLLGERKIKDILKMSISKYLNRDSYTLFELMFMNYFVECS